MYVQLKLLATNDYFTKRLQFAKAISVQCNNYDMQTCMHQSLGWFMTFAIRRFTSDSRKV